MKVVSVKLVQDVSGLLNFWYWIHSHRLIIFIYNFPRKKRKMFPTISKYKLYLECVSYDQRIEWKQRLEGNVKVKCHLKYDVRRPRGNILVCCFRILSNVDAE